jgi:NADP-dependent 3-hydroxy acid dehydrogenase YdfG
VSLHSEQVPPYQSEDDLLQGSGPGVRSRLLYIQSMHERVVVITGASSGIGAALAVLVSQRGAHPVLLARREQELRAVAARCVGDTLPIVTDVTRREDVQRALTAALARFGQIDVWVNNAGRGITRLVSELTDGDLDEMMRVNVKSALYGIQAVLPHFKERGRGHLLCVSSVLGRVPFAIQRSAYSAAKHALNALVADLRVELRASAPGIQVSNIHPGVVATDFGLNALHGGADSRAFPGAQTPEEVAAVIADVIDHPRADVYTRPEAQELVVSYFAAPDMGEVERRPPFVRPGAQTPRDRQ